MSKSRLEAFTDAVIAIIMTILVLDLKSPDGASVADLWEMRHSFSAYFVSFVTLAVYWSNHHHLFQVAKVVSGKILWWNTLLLLCLSLFPFTTAWVGKFVGSTTTELTYGALMLATNVVWVFLSRALVQKHGKDSPLSNSLAGSKKPAFTIGIIIAGLIVGWFWASAVRFLCLASLIPWVVPNRRIEHEMQAK